MHDTLTRIREKRRDDDGFTLIELLVVVVIIGVLVAIAVPVYLNYRQGAADKSAQSDVRGAISAVEQFYTNNSNAYPGSALSKTATFFLATQAGVASTTEKITLSDKTTLSFVLNSTDVTIYKICAFNTGGSKNRYYVYDSQNGGSVGGVTSATFSMTTCA